MIRRFLSRLYWACSRWTLSSTPAPRTPTILIGAPHTSNWDFVLMLAIAWRLDMHVRWLGKASLFRGWRGPIMRRLGGIPVDRDNPAGVVGDVVARIQAGEVFGLVVTPEGTRGSGTYWKSGFYRIAREASLPLTLGYRRPHHDDRGARTDDRAHRRRLARYGSGPRVLRRQGRPPTAVAHRTAAAGRGWGDVLADIVRG